MVAVHIHFTDVRGTHDAGLAQHHLTKSLTQAKGVRVRIAFRLGKTFRESLVLNDRTTLDAITGKLKSWGCRFRVEELVFPSTLIARPLIIVGAPRSGTTLLFETLTVCPETWSLGMESNAVFETSDATPAERGNRLDESDADAETREAVKLGFLSTIRDRNLRLYSTLAADERPDLVRLIEKTPRNTLRIPFLKALFPDSKFVFLYRQPHTNLASLLERWLTPGSVTYRLDGFNWKFLLIPDWRDLVRKPIPEIAAAQWSLANRYIVDDLAKIPREDWHALRYEDLIADPQREVGKICQFASLATDQRLLDLLAAPLPLSRSTLTPPSPDKWKRYEDILRDILPSVEETAGAVETFLSNRVIVDLRGELKAKHGRSGSSSATPPHSGGD